MSETTLRFGYHLPVQHPAGEPGLPHMRDLLDQVRCARDHGFSAIWSSQHFLASPFQYFQPIPLLARCAAEAGDMTMISVMLLALHQPVDVAESLATLDQICEGRYVCGFVLGYRDVEFRSFQLDPTKKVSRFVEALEVVKKLWTEERVTYHGKHFHLDDVVPTTRPHQQPHPPIWLGGSSEGAVRRIARLGYPWAVAGHARLAAIRQQVELYRRTLTEHGHALPAVVPIMKEMLVAEDLQTARRDAEPYVLAKYNAYAKWGQDTVLPEGEHFSRSYEELLDDRFIIGDPEYCLDLIEQHRAQIGINFLVIRCHWPGMPQEQVLRTIRLMGERIIPRLTGAR